MADQPPRRPRTLGDARTEAEAAYRRVTAKVAAAPPKQNVAPGIKEQVTLRIDQDVLEHFQAGGPGWQDRINEALRKAAGKEGLPESKSPARAGLSVSRLSGA